MRNIFSDVKLKEDLVVSISELVVNTHTRGAFSDRKVVLNALELSGEQEMYFLVQREIGRGKKITPHLKGCIKLSDYTYLVFNLYQEVSTGEFFAKALTVLTDKQLRVSNNLGKGNHLNLGFKVCFKSSNDREAYFDEKEGYIDYLRKINWNESQVIIPN
jgi:hypothetical protein